MDNDLIVDDYEEDIDNSEETNATDEGAGQEGDSAEDNSNADSGKDEVEENDTEDEPADDEDVDSEDSDESEDDDSDSVDVTPDENNKAWQKRVERAKRSVERDFLAEANSLSEGVSIERKEIPQASRMWNFLKANPELNKEVAALIDKSAKEGKLTDLKTYASNPLNGQSTKGNSDPTESRMELYEARLDLKFSDPVFKKYEAQINKWAEDNDFPIKSKKNLELAYKAWKGENSDKLVAHAEAKTKKKAQEVKKQKKNAKLVNKKVTSVRGKKLDYKNASDTDILQAEGLSLFKDD